MKQKTNTINEQVPVEEVQTVHLAQDLKNSILIVSVVVNLFMLSLWIALQVTTRFDSSLVSFFLGR